MAQILFLRRLRDFGEKISDSLLFIKTNWKNLFLLYVIFVVPFIIVASIVGVLFASHIYTSLLGSAETLKPTDIFNVEFVVIILCLLMSGASYQASVYSYMRLYEENKGRQPTIAEVGQVFGKKFVKLFFYNIGVSIIVGFCIVIPAMLFAIAPIFAFFIIMISFMLLIMVFLHVNCIYAIEELGFGSGIVRLFDLLRNRWWHSIGYTFIIGLIYYVFGFMVQIVFSLLGIFSINFLNPESLGGAQSKAAITSMVLGFGLLLLINQLFYLIIFREWGLIIIVLLKKKMDLPLKNKSMLLEPITTNTAALKSSIKLAVLRTVAGWWRQQPGQVAVGGAPSANKVVPIDFVSGFSLRPCRWHIILIACFFLSSLQVGAWQKKQDAVQYDSSELQLRILPDSNIKVYTADEEFNYSVQRSQSDSIWDRFWYWVYRNIAKLQANKFWGRFFEVFLWIFCICAFVYAGFKLTGMNSTALFSGDKKNEQLDYMLEEDNIYAINFSEAIQSAINDRNFRLAIRLLYLQSLRKLADAELITWKINKTNDVYLHELASSSYHESFGFLTKAYEYAWYGEMPLDEALFKNIHQQFLNFNSGISA